MTQAEVAEKLGVDRSTYGKYETGQSEPNFETLQKLADIFSTSMADLLPGSNQKDYSEDDIKAAFFNGADPSLTPEEQDELWEDAKEYFRFKIEQRRNRQKNEK